MIILHSYIKHCMASNWELGFVNHLNEIECMLMWIPITFFFFLRHNECLDIAWLLSNTSDMRIRTCSSYDVLLPNGGLCTSCLFVIKIKSSWDFKTMKNKKFSWIQDNRNVQYIVDRSRPPGSLLSVGLDLKRLPFRECSPTFRNDRGRCTAH